MAKRKNTDESRTTENQVIARIATKLKTLTALPGKGVATIRSQSATYYTQIKQHRQEQKQQPRYRSFRLQKRIKPDTPAIPTAWSFMKETFSFLWQHKKIFVGLFVVHCLVYYVVVRAPIQPDVGNIQKAISTTVQQNELSISGAQNNIVTLGAVVSSTGSTQQNTAIAVAVLFIVSLAYIWALRQLHNGHDIKVRDALYQGMTPAIPVATVVTLVVFELLPFAFASFVYTLARTSGVFVTAFEDISFFTVTMLLGLLTFYWMTSGIIAVYMASLPGVYPFYALHSAKKLVRFRRTQIFRRIVALPLLLSVLYLVVLLVSIKVVPSKTFIIAEVFQLMMIPIIHTYLYKLYRAML